MSRYLPSKTGRAARVVAAACMRCDRMIAVSQARHVVGVSDHKAAPEHQESDAYH